MQPKFQIGDTVQTKDSGTVGTVTDGWFGYYCGAIYGDYERIWLYTVETPDGQLSRFWEPQLERSK